MLSTAFLLAASMVMGQAEKEQVPKEAIGELSRLVGTWKMDGGEGDEVYEAEYRFEWVEGKYALRFQCRWSGDYEGRGSGMLVWDANKKEIYQPEAYDDGSICRLHYRLIAPNVWTGETHNSLSDKGEYKAEIKLAFTDKDHYTWTATKATLNGEPNPDMKLRFDRVDGQEDPFKKQTTFKDFEEWTNSMQGCFRQDESPSEPGVNSYWEAEVFANGKASRGKFYLGDRTGTWLEFWDPYTKRIRVFTVASDGTTVEGVICRDGDKWLRSGHLSFADGTTFEGTQTITISKDRNTVTLIDPRYPDKAFVARRVAK